MASQSALQYCLTFIHPFIHSHTHTHTHTHTDGGGSHAGRQPAQQEQSGVRASLPGDASTLTARRRNLSDRPVTSPPTLYLYGAPPAAASLPPENTLVLVLSKARQKMLDRCSPFSLTGLVRPWMAFSMCHSSTRRSSPPGWQRGFTGKTVQLWFKHHAFMSLAITPPFKESKFDTVPRKTACKVTFWMH